MASTRTLTILRKSPIPTIRLHVGQALHATYVCSLWTDEGVRNVKNGYLEGDIEFTLVRSKKDFSELDDGDLFDSKIVVEAFTPREQRYAAKFTISQGNTVLDTWAPTGKFKTAKLLMMEWTLKFV